ncbi:MAG: hypothetical protein EOP42_19200 [Sphingobacteriaceae bacterium]|nr:MAG: hypothetical protein EOP42_19200 [Sphingobacteriaceae bacterium]
MATQFIVNEKGEKTAVVLSLEEYQTLLNQHNQYELTDEYKQMMDEMMADEDNGTARYTSYQEVKDRFLNR